MVGLPKKHNFMLVWFPLYTASVSQSVEWFRLYELYSTFSTNFQVNVKYFFHPKCKKLSTLFL